MQIDIIHQNDYAFAVNMLAAEYVDFPRSYFSYLLKSGNEQLIGAGAYVDNRIIGFVFAHYRKVQVRNIICDSYILGNGFVQEEYRGGILYIALNKFLIEHLSINGAEIFIGFTHRSEEYKKAFDMVSLIRDEIRFITRENVTSPLYSFDKLNYSDILATKIDCYLPFFKPSDTYRRIVLANMAAQGYEVWGDKMCYWIGRKENEVYKIAEVFCRSPFIQTYLDKIVGFIKYIFHCSEVRLVAPQTLINQINSHSTIVNKHNCVLKFTSFPLLFERMKDGLIDSFRSTYPYENLSLRVVGEKSFVIHFSRNDINLQNDISSAGVECQISYEELVNILLGFKKSYSNLEFLNNEDECFFWPSEQF
jgi:hypothetical protein